MTSQVIKPTILEAIKATYPTDSFVKSLKRDMATGNGDPDFAFDVQGILYNRATGIERLYVPDNAELRTRVLREAHDSPMSGHFGYKKTISTVSRLYWWPGMKTQVANYVATCDACQRNKAVNHRPYGLLQPIDHPEGNWDVVTIDEVGPLPKTRSGYNMVVTMVDKASKMVHYAPSKDTATAPQVARIFFDRVVTLHGLPKVIISDRGSKFTGTFWKELFQLSGTKLAFSTAFHPQTDGQSERANRTLGEMLRAYVNHRQDDWDVHLSTVEFAYNNSVNPSTGYTPFYLNYGRHPNTPLSLSNVRHSSPNPAVTDFVQHLTETYEAARANVATAQASQKKHADTKRRHVEFMHGDKVMLSTADLKITARGSKKLGPKFIGPFVITARVGTNAYTLDLPAHLAKLHPTVNVARLRPFKENNSTQFPVRETLDRPPPQLDDEDDGYEVEAVVDKMRTRHGRKWITWYLVKWKGYPDSDNTWRQAAWLRPPHAGSEVWDFVTAYDAEHTGPGRVQNNPPST